jgi:hypothetical protein
VALGMFGGGTGGSEIELKNDDDDDKMMGI